MIKIWYKQGHTRIFAADAFSVDSDGGISIIGPVPREQRAGVLGIATNTRETVIACIAPDVWETVMEVPLEDS